MNENEVNILSEIYAAITTAPAILTPPFIEELITKILPLAESGADNDTVEDAINVLYRQFKDVRDKIKALKRKNLDDAESEVTPGYETLTNNYPDIKKLEANLKQRIQPPSIPPAPDAKN
jgi:hypothetical protein